MSALFCISVVFGALLFHGFVRDCTGHELSARWCLLDSDESMSD